MKVKKIITPVDFGKHTDKLVQFAMDIANQMSADITFCHVLEPLFLGDIVVGGLYSVDFEQKRQREAERRMANLIKDYKRTIWNCSGTILSGDIVDEIVTYAENERAEMIIIGTHGARGLEKILLGNVAERVLKSAHCSTLVMNPYK